MTGRHRDPTYSWVLPVVFVVLGVAAGLALLRGATADPGPQPTVYDHPCVDSHSVTPGGTTWWSCAPEPSPGLLEPPSPELPADPFAP